jgi:malonyl-CoA reductase/3-hydroxypropionate dehydrogenase (NADP+)
MTAESNPINELKKNGQPQLSPDLQRLPRLLDQTVVLTGAAGHIGRHISQCLLREGARVVMTGSDEEKLRGFIGELSQSGFDPDRMMPVAADSADPDACRRVMEVASGHFGPIHALLNNAGSIGPKVTLEQIPFTEADLVASQQTETMLDAARNLLGGPWNMVRAAIPHLETGASIVNVSTIFSRTEYYGRIPYVVPKSGLNALSLGLARELGLSDRGIRVNTVFPGPIESERMDTVFATMDKLQDLAPGSTAKKFKELMILRRSRGEEPAQLQYPTANDVASTVLWLATRESAAFSGHSFEVTNGMQVPAQSRAKLVSWPDKRLIDLRDKVVLILGGRNTEEILAFSQRHRDHGAKVVLAFRDLPSLERARATIEMDQEHPVPLLLCDPLRRDTVERSMQFMEDRYGRLDGVIVLPATPNRNRNQDLSTMDDSAVEDFLRDEVVAPVSFASSVAALLRKWTGLDRAPAIVFVTNDDDGAGNRLNEVNRAAVEELIRVWREEEEHDVERDRRSWACQPNQLVRFSNSEPHNLAFSADWTTTLTNRVRFMEQINLWVPEEIQRSTGKTTMPLGIQRVLPGLHQGKTAVITGASGGIGLQLGRYLALAGTRVLLSARNAKALEEARASIVEEMSSIGYPEPESRVHVMADTDVGSEEALVKLFDYSVELFGNVDILINNAGIAGAEEMVVDMDLDAWTRTIETNLTSNYSLIRKYAPLMKANGHGKILNISSYFGGEKYLAVAYPNRADYSLSKAGQRALAEILSRHLGPEIQINTIAPGPVDGDRLRGSDAKPGLFARRGRLILENKRLNTIHAAILESASQGCAVSDILERIASNVLDDIKQWADAPPAMKKLASRLSAAGGGRVSGRHLMNGVVVPKLLNRLVTAGLLSPDAVQPFLDRFHDGPVPFFAKSEVQAEADKIRQGILERLHLHRMPTDEQVALSTVFYLADQNVSGDTFHPSGGLKFERSVTEGELMIKPGKEDLQQLAGKNVVIVGEVMHEELGALTEGFAAQGVAHIALVTHTEEAASAMHHRAGSTPCSHHLVTESLEATLSEVADQLGQVHVVVSTPMARLPLNPLTARGDESWDRVLSRDEFAQVVDDQLTHHFRVAKQAALWMRCQIVLVTPETSRASTREEFALALFVKNSLHAFTVTLGVEGERLPTIPAVNQVQLTRRARSEEPSTDSERQEELERFVAAVLQCSIPAPGPKESRYLSRIYRGNAVTA